MDEAEAIKMSSLIETHTVQAPVVAQYRPAFMAPRKNVLLPVSPQRRPFVDFHAHCEIQAALVPPWVSDFQPRGVGGVEGIGAAQLIGTRRTQDWDVLGVG